MPIYFCFNLLINVRFSTMISLFSDMGDQEEEPVQETDDSLIRKHTELFYLTRGELESLHLLMNSGFVLSCYTTQDFPKTVSHSNSHGFGANKKFSFAASVQRPYLINNESLLTS